MNILQKKLQSRVQRKGRIRAVVSGTPERPRLHVYISNQHISAQITDDTTATSPGVCIMFDIC